MSFHPCENPRTGTRGPSKSFVSYQRKGLALHPIKSGSLAPQPHSRIDALGRNEPKYRMVYRDTNRVYCNRHFFELGITTHLRVILRRFKKTCRRELHHAATDWKVIHMRVPSPAPSPPFKPPPCSPASGRTNHPPCACGRDQRLHNVWDVNACTANDLTKKSPGVRCRDRSLKTFLRSNRASEYLCVRVARLSSLLFWPGWLEFFRM